MLLVSVVACVVFLLSWADVVVYNVVCGVVFFQAEDGIRDVVRSRGLGDVYKRQELAGAFWSRAPLRRIPHCNSMEMQ